MEKFGKGIFGKGFNLKAEVTNGHCPLCEVQDRLCFSLSKCL